MATADIAIDRPWELLQELIEREDASQLRDMLESLPEGESARAMAHLDADEQRRVMELLESSDAASLLESLPEAQAAEMIDDMKPGDAAQILDHMESDDRADLLNLVDDESAEAILKQMEPRAAQELRELAAHDEDTAGGLMVTEFVAFPQSWTVGQVVHQMRQHSHQYADMQVQYVFVVDDAQRVVGVLRLRDLLFQPDDRAVSAIMIGSPLTVPADMSLDDLSHLFDEKAFLGVPVVDNNGKLLGIVLRAAVEEAMGDRSESDHLKSQGIVGGDELRSMPLRVRCTRRLSWLSVNIVLNVIAATVIALYEETLLSVIALAVFLPIISDMSGCSGNQAVAVSMRELTLGLIKPIDMFYVWIKEASVGVINGLVLGILIAVVATLWKGNPYLGLVVGIALACNTIVAVSIGGTVPLLLKKFNFDPALASGPILTTITDMCGFFLTLSLATAMLPYLVD